MTGPELFLFTRCSFRRTCSLAFDTALINLVYFLYLSTYAGSEHPHAGKFPAECPPNYRFYPNYERVLGMPAPIYADLHPPFHVVDDYYRQSNECWHDENRSNYSFLSDQQWSETRKIVDDSHQKLSRRTDVSKVVWPRLEREYGNPKQVVAVIQALQCECTSTRTRAKMIKDGWFNRDDVPTNMEGTAMSGLAMAEAEQQDLKLKPKDWYRHSKAPERGAVGYQQAQMRESAENECRCWK
ncbi:hypothetical protein P280DRAFT_484579 [Massarina eburnea CBS 473.64]|uniref:Uncharacterized protein n=1 Tax=Massarina eburnea CBS 473.64 TaxID=1395130 RepID=A0A6A6RN06_9PLEO|nr:hypothetical protein P280DRAFT_484579 [Massarina eburnea CBS 473.64]